MDCQIALLRRQYLQLVEPSCLSFPHLNLLQQSSFQAALCTSLFTPGAWNAAPPPPPERYTARVLKKLISLLSEGGSQARLVPGSAVTENSSQEEEEEGKVRSQFPHKKPKPHQLPVSPKHQEIDERLLSLYTRLLSSLPSPSSTTPFLPTSKENVTYTLPPSPFSGRSIGQPITLFESRALISGSGTTGLRTWEAALALAEYLILSHLGRFYSFPGAAVVAGERLVEEAGSVLELGAGTGLVGIVAARLGAGRVVVTDGDEVVCDDLKAGLERNGVADVVGVRRLVWGEEKEGEGNEGERFDLVVGADVTYDTTAIAHLVAELVRLLNRNPSAKAVISATIRNEVTFSAFRDSCGKELPEYKSPPPSTLPPDTSSNLSCSLSTGRSIGSSSLYNFANSISDIWRTPNRRFDHPIFQLLLKHPLHSRVRVEREQFLGKYCGSLSIVSMKERCHAVQLRIQRFRSQGATDGTAVLEKWCELGECDEGCKEDLTRERKLLEREERIQDGDSCEVMERPSNDEGFEDSHAKECVEAPLYIKTAYQQELQPQHGL
ncbi:unnamed protein product [Tuber aestivum]|uniref:FAM86 N-terminal domain-containing protein n=1 Tax=Tuber aestivum TaxID=59557 RepID=A0A292PUF7_9PEZI|nr:unnamed protein product [Tuber aestivum]